MNHGKITFEYSQITKHIFIGTNQCCEGHFDKSLLKMGISADISLEEERLDAPWGVEFFLWLPTRNHFAPSRKQFLVGVNTLKDFESAKISVYVHCERGHGRAPTLVVAYLAAVKGLSVDDAVDFVKKKRPCAHINKNQRSAIVKVLSYLIKELKNKI